MYSKKALESEKINSHAILFKLVLNTIYRVLKAT
jgi:hypothetical protein